MPIRSPTVVSQLLSKSDKRGWLTRWPPRSFANPIWHIPLFVHTDQLLCHCVFICSNVR